MAQISRPFQIALGAVALLGLVWVLALHRPGSSSSSSSAPAESAVPAPASTKASATQSSGAATGKSGGAGVGTYHGSAPGVTGLTGAIAKAHGAVAASQQNAKQLEQKSAQASSSTAATAASSTPSSATAPRTSAHSAAPVKTSSPAHSSSSKTSASKAPSLARQHLVEDELAQGRIVALLFWSPKGADDNVDHNALTQLAKHDHGLAVHAANASEVASFGTITRGIQVFGTPTLLIVGPHGKTFTLTGLQDEYAIQQTVSEARHPHA